ncbi:MAG: LPXTG cell wall anchor domain-containing protein [Kurthia sp.]|nr:LPXTG cell wall anchor domain-containing protein [Candidatus Kurthia equi]
MKKIMTCIFAFILAFQLTINSLPIIVFATGDTESNDIVTEQIQDVGKVDEQLDVESSGIKETTSEDTQLESTANDKLAIESSKEKEAEIEESITDLSAESNEQGEKMVEEKSTKVAKEKPAFVQLSEEKKKKLIVSTEKKENTLKTSAVEITENILSNIQFLDGSGNPVTTAKPMKPGDELSISLDWALKDNHGYTAGDTYTFQLPEQLLIASVQNGTLSDVDGTVYGTYTVDKNGQVIFTFNSEIENNSKITGTFKLTSQLKEDLSGSTEQQLVVDVPGSGDITQNIIVTPNKGSSLTKSGVLDKPKDPTKVTWSIDVNKKLEQLGEITVADTIPAGLELIAGSIKVYELEMNINGTATLGSEITGPFTSFPIVLDDGTKAYRIVYETKILEKTNTKYVNKATMTSDGKTTSAEASVTTQYSKPMAKSAGAYNPETHEADWTIHFNQRGDEVKKEDANFNDYFSEKMELMPETLTVEVLSYDSAGNEVWTSVPSSEYKIINNPESIPSDKNGFQLQFNDDINQAYRIKYKTKLTGDLVFNQKITNTVEGLGQKPISVNKEIGNTFIAKDHGSINYETKTIPWTLTINEDKKTLTEVVITEIFTNKGLMLIESSLTVQTATGVDVPYTLVNKGANGFEIHVIGEVTEKIIVKYKTEFDTTKTSNGKNTFSNAASVSGKYNGNIFLGIDTDSITPGEKSQNNGYKSGDYSYLNKVFTWKIGVNYNKEHVEQLVVEDTSPEGLQVILSSIRIYSLDLTNGGEGKHKDEFTNFTVIEKDIDGKPAFVITFNEPIDDAFQIVYDSEDADGIIEGEYNNDAVIKGTNKESDVHAKVPVLHGGELAVKSGKQDEDVINWQVQYNFSQSSLSNAQLVDQPSANQFVLEDSFHVYEAIPDAANTGKFKKGEEISATLYDVEIAEDGSFKLNFKQDIHEGYYIEYQSYINAAPGEYIENKAWAESDQKSSESKPTSEKVKVVLTNSSASATGETGSLTIYKVDAYTPEKFLPGTEFKLWSVDADGNKRFDLKTAVTDADGKVVFDKLLYKDYIIEETQASKGYKITLSGEEMVEMGQSNQELTVKNEPSNPTAKLKIIKADVENPEKWLAGAQFNLLNEAGEIVLENITTNSEGFIKVDVPLVIEKDEEGEVLSLENDFTIEEIKAPTGYEIVEKSWPITLTYDELLAVTIDNQLIEEPTDPENPTNPEEPTDPKNPTDPENPNDSEKPTNTEKPVDLNKPTNTTDLGKVPVGSPQDKKMPQTGIEKWSYWSWLGISLLFISGLIFYRIRRSRVQ